MFVDVISPAQAVEEAAHLCLAQGLLTSPRGMDTLEVLNPTIVVREPWRVPFTLQGRDLRPFIGAVEALQLVGQTSVPEKVTAGSKPFSNFTDQGVFHGAYGPRLHGNLGPLVELLTRDPYSRQAILTIYDTRQDLGRQVRDTPCTLSLQYFIRPDEMGLDALHARTTMRSNDVWLGLPYDLIQFIALQGALAAALDVEMGTYSHSVGSLHLYSHDAGEAKNIVAPAPIQDADRRLWPRRSIGQTSAWCRAVLAGEPVPCSTDFESWLAHSAGRTNSVGEVLS